MRRSVEPFVFELRVAAQDVRATRAQLIALTARVNEAVPGAVAVLVSSKGCGVQVLNADFQPLDLEALPQDLADELCTFFGPGCWVLLNYRVWSWS